MLIKKIKKEAQFLFVYIHTVTYPDKKNLYTTIEVIEKNHPDRLRFIDPEITIKSDATQSFLIKKMIEYNALGWKLSDAHQLDRNDYSCPVYHCLVGFNHPKLASYLKLFNTGVVKEKKTILDTLNFSKKPEYRAAAAFLIGHLSDPQEIIAVLLPHVNDNDPLVRNNVIRVIRATMEKARINDINPMPFLDLLNSPYGSDRNKSLAVLLYASEQESTRHLIIQKEKSNLLSLLRLKQPNNHEQAYLLLKKISGKNYGEYDIKSWEKWFHYTQKSLQNNLD